MYEHEIKVVSIENGFLLKYCEVVEKEDKEFPGDLPVQMYMEEKCVFFNTPEEIADAIEDILSKQDNDD